MTSPAKKPSTSAERMREHRRRMREKGFVQKTIWVPDLNNPSVIERYRRSAQAIAAEDPASKELDAWMEAVRDWPTDEWPEYEETENGK